MNGIDRRRFAASLILGASACHPSQAPLTRKPRIALVMKSLANAFFVTMAEGARFHQQRHSQQYDLLINGTRNESDLAQQVAILDQMIASGADAIVIAPADSKAAVPAAARAVAAGVPVINIDNAMDRAVQEDYALHLPFVGPDGQSAAQAVGTVLAQTLSAGDQVAILEGIATANNSQQRRDGLLAAAAQFNLDVVTVQSANWEQGLAASVAANILVQYPNLKGLMCANDNMALGAASAVEQAGRAESVRITGFDNVEAIRPLILRGVVIATADQHGDQLAVYGIECALEAIATGGRPSDRTTPVDIITRDVLAGSPGQH